MARVALPHYAPGSWRHIHTGAGHVAAARDDDFAHACALIDDLPRTPDKLRAALPFLQRAADGGLAAAQSRLARWHLYGLGGLPRDPYRAFDLLRVAAVGGHDADAQYWLARMVLEGPSKEDAAAGAPAAGVAAADTAVVSEDNLVTYDDTGVRQRAAYEAARGVLLEIRALRKAALRRKVRQCV